jgi:tRNA nucleotidyltransferase (CCA-adding enzyme)
MLASELPQNDLSKKRWLRRYGVETVRCALSCRDVFYGGEESQELRRILKSGECFSLKHLAVSGDDLLALGLRGRAVGEMLDFLLEYVMEYPDNNRRELLLSLAAGTEE